MNPFFPHFKNKHVPLDFTTELTSPPPPPPLPPSFHSHCFKASREVWKKSLHNYLRCFPPQRDVDLKLSGTLVCMCGGEGSVSPESGDRHCPLAVSPRNVFFTPLCASIHSPLPLTCFIATLLEVVEGLLCCFLCMLHSCRLLRSPPPHLM